MAHRKQTTMRGALRREITGTIALLTDEDDFSAMRRYRSFTFDDHPTYLAEVEGLLKTLASQGKHTTVALFDPEEYAEFCTDTGIEPDAPDSRNRFTAALAATGATIPYGGQPLADLVPELVDEAVRHATVEFAGSLLTRAGDCASCGDDIGKAAFERASHLLVAVLHAAGPGAHHLVCSTTTEEETLLAALDTTTVTHDKFRIDETEALEFATVLAAGIATTSPAGLVMRTSIPGSQDRVRGWRLRGEALHPLTASEVFDAYCTDADSGDLISPEPGVEYCPAPALEPTRPSSDHRHGTH
ncbi:hypothetical protein [Streptomyces tsukubensis]|uniref:Uncharacterized protein n=1 Tax=Streptomyces tsukubensis TaxID=83656 RepID=A0A1V3ZYX7_9ACTN|nr:hypothetical protein [Streptomyces tsukubensis]OON71619.1 hypothetical protein B1H18_33170 [Streptomyces tsukubensis]QFR92476.1 hypothetical protein GBW32_04660 [Streptomyces tsukubensis]